MRTALVALISVAVLVGCSDSSTGPNDGTDVLSGFAGSFTTTEHGYTATTTGNMRVRLLWSGVDLDLDLYLSSPDCPSRTDDSCTMYSVSENTDTESETLTHQVAAGEEFKIWVESRSQVEVRAYTIRISYD